MFTKFLKLPIFSAGHDFFARFYNEAMQKIDGESETLDARVAALEQGGGGGGGEVTLVRGRPSVVPEGWKANDITCGFDGHVLVGSINLAHSAGGSQAAGRLAFEWQLDSTFSLPDGLNTVGVITLLGPSSVNIGAVTAIANVVRNTNRLRLELQIASSVTLNARQLITANFHIGFIHTV